MAKHQHRAVEDLQKTVGFSGAVSDRQNPAAHGNVCFVDTCSCGAKRKTNVNGRHSERGEWTMPPSLHDYQTGEKLRTATRQELAASIAAAKRDGGAGVIQVGGRSCYAQD